MVDVPIWVVCVVEDPMWAHSLVGSVCNDISVFAMRYTCNIQALSARSCTLSAARTHRAAARQLTPEAVPVLLKKAAARPNHCLERYQLNAVAKYVQPLTGTRWANA